MEKLKLNVDALRVDGFATVAADSASLGTVRGHDDDDATIRCTTTCTEIGSCGHICP